MKQLLIHFVTLSFLPFASFAQLGDFQLNSSGQRKYETIAANPELKGGPLKKFFIGKNYRKEWAAPVQVPVINFKTDFGGLTPKEEGGGRQTHSLQLEDSAGVKWVLRSVRKYPVNVVVPALQGTIIEKMVADGISASYPYSTVSVGTLAKAAGVSYFPNSLVYIPDVPALDTFRDKFKNSLSFLERRSVDDAGKEKTYNTFEVVQEVLHSPGNRVDQQKVLKARILDNFIMDFDRHDDQWEWVKRDSAGSTIYFPVPKDRDQAFFQINGLLPTLARIFQPSMGQLQGLRAKAANIHTFNFVAKDFDRSFLNELDEQTWSNSLDAFLMSVTDATIDEAISRQPDGARSYHGPAIAQTLKEKRRFFKADMMTYYRSLSRIVSITGTNEKEQFLVHIAENGTAMVQVSTIDSSEKPGAVVYQRYFSPSVTRELRLYGLEGDDQFLIRGSRSNMTIRLIGGPGNDFFVNESGEAKAIVYDVSYEKNGIAGSGMKKRINDDPLTNEYRRLDAAYMQKIPGIGIEITREGGLFLGPSYKITKPGFRKDPYAAMHFFYLTRALESASWHARYNADFIGVARKTDLLLRTEAFLPTVRTYFFGFGNNSIYNKQKGWQHYVTRYQVVDAALQLRYRPASWLQFSAGPLSQYLKLEESRNKGNFASTVIPQNGVQAPLYNGLWYGGGEVRAEVNLRNHPRFTTEGVHSTLYAKLVRGFSKGSGDFEQVGGTLSLFTDFPLRRMVVLATSFGADRNFGSFQFPQAHYLGFRQNLRGYRFQRFAGTARFYNNSEVRVNLGAQNFYFFKGLLGLLAFHDAGRVWIEGEDSGTWHRGYGYGVWVAPFNQVAIIATVASSKEERRWLQLSFGFQF